MHCCLQEQKNRIPAVQLRLPLCCLAETGWPWVHSLSLEVQLHCCCSVEHSYSTLAAATHLKTALQNSELLVSLVCTGMALARQQQQRIQQQEGPVGLGHDVPEAMLLSATGLGSNQAGLEVSGVGGAARVGAEHAGGWLDRDWTVIRQSTPAGVGLCENEPTCSD